MTQQIDILASLKAMPPLPHVAHRVLEVVRDPEYSVDELVGLVRADPSLTARILKLCNSALYGLHKEVSTVSDAIGYLGTRNLVKLVLVSCAASTFRATRTTDYTDASTLWRHTFATAVACQYLAQRSGFAQIDTAFTAGILHNLGKVALSQAVDESRLAAITAAPAASHAEQEIRLFGIDHAAAAGIVVDAWGLPRELRRAVRGHHDPEIVAGESPLPAILQLADTLALEAGIGNPFPGIPLRIEPHTLARLHLSTEDVDAAITHVVGEMQRQAELLNLEGLEIR